MVRSGMEILRLAAAQCWCPVCYISYELRVPEIGKFLTRKNYTPVYSSVCTRVGILILATLL